MTNPATRSGEEPTIRAIVFKEGDLYVAQCLEYDVCVQGATIPVLLDRLELTVEAEFASCAASGKKPCELIGQAPNYYHSLWEKRSVTLKKFSVVSPTVVNAGCDIDVALADLPVAA